MTTPWPSLFDECHPEPPASEAAIARLLHDVSRPLTGAEIADIFARQTNPFAAGSPLHDRFHKVDPAPWKLPTQSPPEPYLSFLRYSNGGSFRTGGRWFDPVLKSFQVREYLLAYHIPEHLPQTLPFAFDGSGTFYLFDMRRPAIDGEFPILLVHAGNLDFDDALLVGETFVEACSNRRRKAL